MSDLLFVNENKDIEIEEAEDENIGYQDIEN